jgi:CubicO group peptidase (beta-lactamase class C family)
MALALFAFCPAAFPAEGVCAADKSSGGLQTRVDAYLAPHVTNRDFSGAVLIARGDGVLVNKAYGMANYELEVRNTPDTKFRIASLTKTFTAAAIVMLEEEGRLRFADPVQRFIPDFPHGDKITILHLLSHRSGLSNPEYNESFATRISLEGLIERIKKRPLQFEPGTREQYSNAGFNVLAYIVERASGISYDEFLRRRIFGPLGMQNTGNFSDEEVVHRRASGYLPGPGPSGIVNAPWYDIGFSMGSGSISSTTGDLLRWGRAVNSEQLFKLKELKYPYGWGRFDRLESSGIQQTGLTTGYTSSLAIYFSQDLYVICLGNIECGKWIQWANDLAALALGKSVPEAPVRRFIAMTPKRVEQVVGHYENAQHRIEVLNRGGDLWMRLDEWPVLKYLAPLGDNIFDVRADLGDILFEGKGPSDTLIWRFPNGASKRYTRKE